MRVVATSFIGGLLLAGCQVSPSAQDLYRCHEAIDLHELIQSVGVPAQAHGWDTGKASKTLAQRLFDGESEAVLSLPNIAEFVGNLCHELEDHLASRCSVPAFWSGIQYCVARTEARFADTTDSNGVYIQRPSQGRVALFATSLPDGRTKLVLTHTEWPN